MDSEKLKKLLDIGKQMAENRDLDPLLESAMFLALGFVGAEYGYIVLLDNGNLVFRVGEDKNGNHLQEPQEQISHTIVHEVIQTGVGTIIEDALDSLDTSSVLGLQIRSVICAPLISRGRTLGAVYVENRLASHLFDEEDLELLEYFAAQAAIAIENAMLNEDLEARVEARTAELARTNAKLKEMAITDPLTRVFNRRHFFELAQQELARAQRYGQPLSAIMLDLDHFKQINDHYGHMAGDHVLQAVVQLVRDNIREVDILGRYGGEEFAILMPNTALPGTLDIAQRVCMTIASQSVQVDDETIPVTTSLGVVSLVDAKDINVEMLLDKADQALYAAKQAGRNRVEVWKES